MGYKIFYHFNKKYMNSKITQCIILLKTYNKTWINISAHNYKEKTTNIKRPIPCKFACKLTDIPASFIDFFSEMWVLVVS